MAASLRRDLHLEVETVEGRYGEFTVLVDGEEIIRGGTLGFVGVLPSVRKVRELVEARAGLVRRNPLAKTGRRISSGVKWTVLAGLVASFLATALVAVTTRVGLSSLLGWAAFFELLQLPMISAARHGRLDPCTAWLRRVLGGKHADA